VLKLILADPHARPLSKTEVARLLSRPNLLRLAYLDEDGKRPIVHPVWYYYSKGKFFIASDINSAKAKILRKNHDVYFLVDESPKGGPTQGVRGRGTAKVIDDTNYGTRVTRRNVKKYMGSLTSKSAKRVLKMGPESCVIEITPSYMATWKF
jgi:nitroimidazol reductase NimA-like FMN-containing flavoprotein (pyridoxamine 5'-phosphate oxidase superfamily)